MRKITDEEFMKTITIRVMTKDLEFLENRAKTYRISLAGLIRMLLGEYIDKEKSIPK